MSWGAVEPNVSMASSCCPLLRFECSLSLQVIRHILAAVRQLIMTTQMLYVHLQYDCCGVHSLHDWQDVFVDLRKAETGDEKPYDEWAKGIPVSCCRRGFKEGKMMFRELCQGIRTEVTCFKICFLVTRSHSCQHTSFFLGLLSSCAVRDRRCYCQNGAEIPNRFISNGECCVQHNILSTDLIPICLVLFQACWGAISFSLSFCWLCVTITAEIPNARKRKLPPDLWEPATTPPMNRTVLAPKSYPMAHSDTELAHEPLRVSRMRIDDGAQWAEAWSFIFCSTAILPVQSNVIYYHYWSSLSNHSIPSHDIYCCLFTSYLNFYCSVSYSPYSC